MQLKSVDAKVLVSFVEVVHVPYKLKTEDCKSFR